MASYSHNANDVTPDMTGPSAPSPVVASASSEYNASYPAWMAFEHTASAWMSEFIGDPHWLKIYSGGDSWYVVSYTVTNSSNITSSPKNWTLQGSNNDTDWTIVDTQSNQTGWSLNSMRTFSVADPGSFSYYRLNISNTNGATYAQIGELELIGGVPPVEVDAAESSESTDSVDGYLLITADVSESSSSSDDVLGTKDQEVEDVSESSESTDAVSVYQSNSICDVEESSESTDSTTATAGVDVDVSESSESTDSVEALNTLLASLITESSESTDTVDCIKWTGTTIEVADSIYIRDSVIYDLAVLVQDTMALTDSTAAMLSLLIHDFIMMQETQTVNQSGTKSITESMILNDAAYPALCLSISDTVAAADAPTVALCLEILEHLWFTELVTAIGTLSHAVSDTVDAADSVQFGWSQAVSDALAVVDVASIIGTLVGAVTESLVVTETLTGSLTMPIPVTESLTLTDTVASQGVLYNVVYDTLHLSVTVELDGETWECYVLNTPKFLPSVYSGFDFNSYCVHENRAFGMKTNGIYELTGDTDNGVAFHTGVQFSESVFGSANYKRFRKAYVGVEGTTPKMVMEDENGNKMVYTIDSDGEVDASRALKSRKWKLAITDFDELSYVKLYPVVLAK